MSEKNILVNAYTHVNLGDDLFLKILVERFPSVHFTILANGQLYQTILEAENISYLEIPKTIWDYPILRRICSKINKYQYQKIQYQKRKDFLSSKKDLFDGILTIGGSIFMENPDKRLLKLNNHYLFSEVFQDKPKFIVGANFGPFTSDEFLNHYTHVLSRYSDVCFRDKYSVSLFPHLSQVRHHADVVFGGNFTKDEKWRKTIGFSIMDFDNRSALKHLSNDYKKMVHQITSSHLAKGFKVYLFSFCKEEGDGKAIQEILNLFGEEEKTRIETVFYIGNIDAFLNIYRKMEIMIPTRFHAMILSMIFEQKIFPIIYSKKMMQVLEDLNYDGDYLDMTKTNSLNMKMEEISSHIFELDDSVKKDAEKQFEKFEKFIEA